MYPNTILDGGILARTEAVDSLFLSDSTWRREVNL